MTPPSTPPSADRIADLAAACRWAADWTDRDGKHHSIAAELREASAALSDAVKRRACCPSRPLLTLHQREEHMRRTDEARRLLQAARFWVPDPVQLHADIARWLAANPESKPDAGVTEAQVKAAAKAIVAEWQTMVNETRGLMTSADAARAFVSPGNFRLVRAGLNAALASAVPAAPETIPEQWADAVLDAVLDAEIVVGPDRIVQWSLRTTMDRAGVHTFQRERLREALLAAPAVSQPPADTRETGNG